MAITQITNNILLDGTILPSKLNVSANMRTFLENATSTNLAAAVSGSSGSGNLVFDTSPTLLTPTFSRNSVGTVYTAQDGNGCSATMTTDSSGRCFLTVNGKSGAAGLAGAYFTANGVEEAWFNVVSTANNSTRRWMRFGNRSERFTIQLLNDTGTAITSSPFSISNIAPTDSFYMSTNGNVGFGAPTPNEKLTVAGNLSATGTVNSGAITSTSTIIASSNVQSSNGNVSCAAAGSLSVLERSRIYSPADGFFQLRDNGNTNFASVSAADFESTSSLTGVILRSPDNSRWRLTVTNIGALSTTKL